MSPRALRALAVGLFLTLLFSAGLVSASTAPAQAAPAPAFDCLDPRFFAMAENSNNVQLYEGRYTASGSSEWNPLGATQSGSTRYNALAFNPIDEHLYGIVSVTSGYAGHLVRINSDGSVTQLGQSSPALGSSYSTLWDSGEFDAAGNYYVGSGNAGSTGPASIRKISGLHNVTGTSGTRPTLQTIPLSPTPRYADLAFKDGYLWSHNYGQSNTFYRIHVDGPTPGTVDSFSSAGVLPAASSGDISFGSVFTMTNGNLALISTTGKMFQVSVADSTSANPSFDLVGAVPAPTNARSDAANCSTALPASLSVEKVGPAQVEVGSTIQWDLTVTNEGPGVTSGFVLTDTLPSGLSNITVASNDSGCVLNGGQTAVTCNGGRLEVNETAEVTITATAPNRVGSLVNQAYVAGNEDPDPNPPVTAETEVTLATLAEQPATLDVTGELVTDFDETSLEGGAVTFDPATSTFTYAPPAGFSGTDQFTYQTPSGEVTVWVVVRPTAGDDSDTTVIGVPVTLSAADLLGNDVGVGLTVESVGTPSHGTATIVDGAVVYTPEPGFYGTDSFDYTLAGDGGSDTATVTITVSAAAPVAVDDAFAIDADATLTVEVADLLANDSGTEISVTGVSNPSTGTVEIVDGEVVFAPAPGFHGEATFDYEIEGPGGTDVATVTVTVAPHAPVAQDDAFTMDADATLTVQANDLLANDSGTAVTRTDFTQPAHGTVAVDGDGELVYTPDAGFSGSDSFEYTIEGPGGSDSATVSITVAPVAIDDAYDTVVDVALTLTDALDNDLGLDLGVDDFTQGAHGTVSVNLDGDLVYTPDAGFSGSDSFQYTVVGDGGSDTATVSITVAPVAIDDAFETVSAVSVVLVDLLANDLGIDLDVDDFGQPSHGTVSVDLDGVLVYTPDAGFSGSDSFPYTVVGDGGTDTATVSITVAPVAMDDAFETSIGAPVTLGDLRANDLGVDLDVDDFGQPSHGTVSENLEGELVYTPDAGFHGSDSFEYTIAGDGGQSTATVAITVSPQGAAAADDSFEIVTGATLTIGTEELLANDAGTEIDVTGVSSPSTGSVEIVDGEVVFSPEEGFSGAASFEYTIEGPGGSDTATVTITVVPVAVDQSYETPAETPVTFDPVAAGIGTELALVEIEEPEHGILEVGIDGQVTFTPAPGYSGVQTVTYTVRDAHGGEATGTIVLRVSPLAGGDHDVVTTGASVEIDLLRNDVGREVTVSEFTQPANGTVTVNDDGVATYTANAGFMGVDSFTYTITDADGQSVTAAVTIDVAAAPVEEGDADTPEAPTTDTPEAPATDGPEAPTTGGGGLALTGPESVLAMIAAALLLLAAGASVLVSRRRAVSAQ